ncbi:MAG: type toxin-antitoxin system RelE/ParE family toxin [Caulobacter sp.]|nr:type toxin-antitoxin system RelE/ParE family toxin [Caulobacter sp.]
MRIVWLPSGRRTLTAQIDYIAEDSPRAAARQQDMVEGATDRLADHPLSGREGRMPGTRELVVPATPFIIIYAVRGEELAILRVLHGAQAWPPAD